MTLHPLPRDDRRILPDEEDYSLPELPQLVLDLGHRPSHAEADFIAFEGNEMALRHVRAYPDWSFPLALIVGPAKSGKSHLARIWAERSGAGSAGPNDLERLATAGGDQPLVVEDADRGGYPEMDLFHLLNQSMRDGRPLLMTARSAPESWPLATNDVRSRIRLAAQFRIEPPSATQLLQFLVKLFADRQIAVDPRVVSYMMPRMERSPQEVVALVALIDALALARGCAPGRALVAEALEMRAVELMRREPREDEED